MEDKSEIKLLYKSSCSNETIALTFVLLFFMSALPCVDDAQFIKQSRVAVLLANDTTIMKPIEFHTAINFDFNESLQILSP